MDIDNVYIFGKNKITFRKGAKDENDYLIFQNGVQIPDIFLFSGLLKQISSEEEAKRFLNLFCGYNKIQLSEDSIICNPSPLDCDDLYDYCIKSGLKPEQQELLFIFILRCDIDNICYPPPRLNGCIRIFIQVLLLFAYEYKWTTYYVEAKVDTDLDKFVYKIGFPRNSYGVDTSAFFEIYKKYFKKI